jgi:hypothetical protein
MDQVDKNISDIDSIFTEPINKIISAIVGAFTDPVITFPHPEGWGDDVPNWIRDIIVLERLEMIMDALKGAEMTATDAEVCHYLFTVSLADRLSIYWNDIWGYVTTKVYRKWGQPRISGDLMVASLTDNQMKDLERLKKWIYYHIKTRDEYQPTFYNRSIRKQKWEEMTSKIVPLPLMFDF